jgi:predicted alpha/beta superfamily hydrolase
MLRSVLICLSLLLAVGPAHAQSVAPEPTPIVIGQSYALPSGLMGQTREVNVWLPADYAESNQAYPVLYLLDGGQDQDFHHISGLAQLGSVNGVTRAFIVVGVSSVDRRNELALPTTNAELLARYPTQGQSQRFRDFLRDEVQPWVRAGFRTDGHEALMGESLAGLFVVETFLKAPEMFDAFVASSPSLWWDEGQLAAQAGAHLRDHSNDARTLMLFLGDEGAEMQAPMDVLVAALEAHALPNTSWAYDHRPTESHASLYHGAAMSAVRALYPWPEETPE